MFGLSKRQPKGETAVINIDGMHCTSCTLTIDGALEDLGVLHSATNYAKGQTKVEYDPTKISLPQIVEEIEKQGYRVVQQQAG